MRFYFIFLFLIQIVFLEYKNVKNQNDRNMKLRRIATRLCIRKRVLEHVRIHLLYSFFHRCRKSDQKMFLVIEIICEILQHLFGVKFFFFLSKTIDKNKKFTFKVRIEYRKLQVGNLEGKLDVHLRPGENDPENRWICKDFVD